MQKYIKRVIPIVAITMIIIIINTTIVTTNNSIMPIPSKPTNNTATIETIPQATTPKETVPTKHENYISVPHYFQGDYPNDPYGKFGSVATHGCGITSLAMVATYLLDKDVTPVELAQIYADYNTKTGSKWILFPDSAKDMGLTIILETWDVRLVAEELKNGSVAIACCSENSIFTDGGHFIVITGITHDGKFLVQDPYIGNYTIRNSILDDGFKNGFDQKYFWACHPIWVYAPKGENDIDLHPEKYTENP